MKSVLINFSRKIYIFFFSSTFTFIDSEATLYTVGWNKLDAANAVIRLSYLMKYIRLLSFAPTQHFDHCKLVLYDTSIILQKSLNKTKQCLQKKWENSGCVSYWFARDIARKDLALEDGSNSRFLFLLQPASTSLLLRGKQYYLQSEL